MYVVTVDFSIERESTDSFIEAMQANARASVQKEAGCEQFDVCIDPSDRSRVFLYELYVDQAAFDEHLRSEHFLAFDRATAGWIESKVVRKWQRLD